MSVAVLDLQVEHPHGRIFARRWTSPSGAGRAPFVLFHDSLGCVDLWRDFPAAMARATGRDVVAYDRLGFGRSDARVEPPGLGFVAEEARAYFPVIRRALGIEDFIALGHSVGGGMAIECAANEADRCVGLVTIAAQVFAEDRTLTGIRAARLQFAEASQLERLAKYHGPKARWVVDAWTEAWLDPAFSEWSLTSVLPRVRCPILAIHGGLDEYGSTIHADLISTLSGRGAKKMLLSEAGHLPHREAPEKIAEAIAEFDASSIRSSPAASA